MVGTELLETGQLSAAIERVAGEVKFKPTDLAARTFYFELLCLNGDLDRAAKQLEVLAAAKGELFGGTGIYLGALQAERERRRFFSWRSQAAHGRRDRIRECSAEGGRTLRSRRFSGCGSSAPCCDRKTRPAGWYAQRNANR